MGTFGLPVPPEETQLLWGSWRLLWGLWQATHTEESATEPPAESLTPRHVAGAAAELRAAAQRCDLATKRD